MASKNWDQERAAFAWQCVETAPSGKDYENLAKSAPALIMNSGLMQTLAFFKDKGKEHHQALLKHIAEWLNLRLWQESKKAADFEGLMNRLFNANSALYRRATEEALALLRWIRQFASAKGSSEKK